MLRFRVLGASLSRFGCFVLRSSFSSASFSKLPLQHVGFVLKFTHCYSSSQFSTKIYIVARLFLIVSLPDELFSAASYNYSRISAFLRDKLNFLF